jgi:hypothetical protein
MTDAASLSIEALMAAIDRFMKTHPLSGDKHRTHPDANAMGDPFAVMVLGGLRELERGAVSAKALDAFERWKALAHFRASVNLFFDRARDAVAACLAPMLRFQPLGA